MKGSIDVPESVIEQEYVSLKIDMNELGNAIKAKVFVNGKLNEVPVVNGSFSAIFKELLEYGDNRIQINITCKVSDSSVDHTEFVINVKNHKRILLEFKKKGNSILISGGKKGSSSLGEMFPVKSTTDITGWIHLPVSVMKYFGAEITKHEQGTTVVLNGYVTTITNDGFVMVNNTQQRAVNVLIAEEMMLRVENFSIFGLTVTVDESKVLMECLI